MGMQPLPTVSLRQPASMKTGDTLDPSPVGGFTKIYHPKFVWAPMFTLPNLEYDGTSKRFGVHHATALWAAQIIACNTLSFLSTEQNAASDPGFPLDAILLAGSYFFYRKDGSSEYGVCESFSCWGFPHQEVPAEWQAMVSGVSLISGQIPRMLCTSNVVTSPVEFLGLRMLPILLTLSRMLRQRSNGYELPFSSI